MVDGKPYRHTGAMTDGNLDRTAQHRGQLVLELPAGTHTAILQWASFYDERLVATIHPLSFAVAIVQATKAVVATGRRGELVACMYPQPHEGKSTCMHCGDDGLAS